MHLLTPDRLLPLMAAPAPPCISLYQPTHRRRPENRQDPIRFRNLVRTVAESLRRKYPVRDVRELLEPFQELAADSLFWNHTLDGLAVLAGPGVLEVFPLQRPVPELALVADSFHIKPLLRHLQSADRFQVLGLSYDRAGLCEGHRYTLDPVALPDGFPALRKHVVPPVESELGMSVASTSGGVGSPKMLRGHGEGKEDLDTEKFFRAVDRAVAEQFSKPSGLPLVLAALPEHQALFRRVSQNPFLLADGVNGNPGALAGDELRAEVWRTLEPHYLARLERLKEEYRTARARQLGSDDLAEVAEAVATGRVGTLLVEADRVVPGRFDPVTGRVEPGDLAHPEVGDLLDDLAEAVLRRKGEVVVVPAARMPSAAGVAATYRF